jgi:aspartyl-tRNA(Asn)/glutamyl-tRNA(Gln) amidotransferase subunit B
MSSTIIKTVANIITTVLLSVSKKYNKNLEEIISPAQILVLSNKFETNQISNQGVNEILEYLANTPNEDVEIIIEKLNLAQVNDNEKLLNFVNQVLLQSKEQVTQYKNGKVEVIGYLVGQCMKISNKQGNPAKFKELLTIQLNN